MSISDYIQPEAILLNVDAADKNALLDILLDAAARLPAVVAQPPGTTGAMREMILRRENYGSTAIGHGILFPHARVPGFRGLALVIATCRRPLDLPTPDGEPVFMACLGIVPEERPSLAIKVVAALSRLFMNDEARTFITAAASPETVAEYIAAQDIPLETTIHVRDIYLPYEWTATPDTPLREIARMLLLYRMPGAPVLDAEGRLLGEVTLTRLERYGLPNFFLNLKSVSFVREFDPFEQYFLKEAGSVARDVMNEDAVRLPENGTLMEVIHALAVKRRALVHVCENEKAVGYVDCVAVLNRVLSP